MDLTKPTEAHGTTEGVRLTHTLRTRQYVGGILSDSDVVKTVSGNMIYYLNYAVCNKCLPCAANFLSSIERPQNLQRRRLTYRNQEASCRGLYEVILPVKLLQKVQDGSQTVALLAQLQFQRKLMNFTCTFNTGYYWYYNYKVICK